MFWKQKAVVVNHTKLLETIKRDIENQLNEKGVMISGINAEMSSESISFSIYIQGLPVAKHINTDW